MPNTANDTPVVDLLGAMTMDSLERSNLEPKQLMIARLAALVAVDAPPVSYLTNIAVAGDAGVDADMLQDILLAIAPIVGTARVASAGGKIVRALGLAIAVADEEMPSEDV